MSTATFQEPLRAVPPPDQIREQFNALLAARQAAHRAFDAIMAAPRKAAGFIGRLVTALHLSRPLGLITAWRPRLVRYAKWSGHRLGRLGVVSGIGSVVTHPQGQALIRNAGRFLGRVVGWLARTTYRAVDSGLRLFGRPGNRAADALFAGSVRIGGPIGHAASGAVDRIARFTDPQAAHVRLLAGLSRSYLVHRVARSFVSNKWLRLLLDSALIPTLADSRVGQRLRSLVRQLMSRLGHLRKQRQTMTVVSEAVGSPVLVEAVVVPTADDEMSTEDVKFPQPSNRAGRRAMQRQEAQQRHRPVS